MLRKVSRFLVLGGILLLITSCQPARRGYQRIAAELARLEGSSLNDFSPPDSLQQAIATVDSLLREANELLPQDDPRRFEHPFSPVLNRLKQYRAYLQAYQTDASLYNIGGYLQRELSQGNTPLTEKIARCQPFLRKAPEYYQAASRKLVQPDSGKLRLAIRKQIRGLQLLDNSYTDSLRRRNPNSPQEEQYVQSCRYAMKDYIAWCNSQLIEQSQ